MKRTKDSDCAGFVDGPSKYGGSLSPRAAGSSTFKTVLNSFENYSHPSANDPVVEISLSSDSDESVIQISSDESDSSLELPTESAKFLNTIREVMKDAYSSAAGSDHRRVADVEMSEIASDFVSMTDPTTRLSKSSLLQSSDYARLQIPALSSHKNSKTPPTSQTKTKKDLLKEEAAKKKELKRLEMKEKKEALEREKLLKKSVNEVIKNSKPGEVHKFMTIILEEHLPGKMELVQIIEEAGISHETTAFPIISKSFSFKRELSYQAMGEDLQMHKVTRWETEDQLLVLLDPEDIVPKIYVQIYGTHTDSEVDDMDFITFVKSLQATASSTKITLLLYRMDNYFKNMKKNTQQEFRDRVLNGDAPKKNRRRKAQLPTISILEFQSALVELQLETKVNYRHVNSTKEMGRMLVQYTKAIAEAPYKRERKEQGFDWFASADSAGSVKVDSKDGKGLKMLWTEQIRLFNHVGIDTAQAIVKMYPTPRDLIDRYSKCLNLEEGQNLLRDIQVRMGVGTLAKNRKVGPELSKKMYRFFTSTNPERCLGSTQEF